MSISTKRLSCEFATVREGPTERTAFTLDGRPEKIDLTPLITHRFPLQEINRAFDTFTQRIDNAIKVIVHPQK